MPALFPFNSELRLFYVEHKQLTNGYNSSFEKIQIKCQSVCVWVQVPSLAPNTVQDSERCFFVLTTKKRFGYPNRFFVCSAVERLQCTVWQRCLVYARWTFYQIKMRCRGQCPTDIRGCPFPNAAVRMGLFR